jgi:tellurite resistance protein
MIYLYIVIKSLIKHTTISKTGRNGLMEATVRVEKWFSTPSGIFHSEWKNRVEFQIRNSTRQWNSTHVSGIPLMRGHANERREQS